MRQAIDQIANEFPKTQAPTVEVGSAQFEDLLSRALGDVVQTASPGTPLNVLGVSNGEVLQSHVFLVKEAVRARVKLLSSTTPMELRKLDAVELVQRGFCDPIRLFVKQEPHSIEKVRLRRFRLISSVSLIDQLVERVLFGEQNRTEIDSWWKIPSKPGMGISQDEQLSKLWSIVQKQFPVVSTDMSGWDWSVQGWEYDALGEIQLRLTSTTVGPYAFAVTNRVRCLSLAVFSLSSGLLIEQIVPGVMKSGSYITSSGNSKIRSLAARLVGSKWNIAMGDDCVELPVDDHIARYAVLGHVVKDYRLHSDRFQFCSHEFLSPNVARPLNWHRMFYRLLSNTMLDGPERWSVVMQFEHEMRHSPYLSACREYLSREGWYPQNVRFERDAKSPSQAEDISSSCEGSCEE